MAADKTPMSMIGASCALLERQVTSQGYLSASQAIQEGQGTLVDGLSYLVLPRSQSRGHATSARQRIPVISSISLLIAWKIPEEGY
jgi:hypothetical protein